MLHGEYLMTCHQYQGQLCLILSKEPPPYVRGENVYGIVWCSCTFNIIDIEWMITLHWRNQTKFIQFLCPKCRGMNVQCSNSDWGGVSGDGKDYSIVGYRTVLSKLYCRTRYISSLYRSVVLFETWRARKLDMQSRCRRFSTAWKPWQATRIQVIHIHFLCRSYTCFIWF